MFRGQWGMAEVDFERSMTSGFSYYRKSQLSSRAMQTVRPPEGSPQALAVDLTGIWEGHFFMRNQRDPTAEPSRHPEKVPSLRFGAMPGVDYLTFEGRGKNAFASQGCVA
jgi:hypothetical protein